MCITFNAEPLYLRVQCPYRKVIEGIEGIEGIEVIEGIEGIEGNGTFQNVLKSPKFILFFLMFVSCLGAKLIKCPEVS